PGESASSGEERQELQPGGCLRVCARQARGAVLRVDPRRQRLLQSRGEPLDEVPLQVVRTDLPEVHFQRLDTMKAIRVAGLREAAIDDRPEALALNAAELRLQLPRSAPVPEDDLQDLPADPVALAAHSFVIGTFWLAAQPTPVRAWTAI